MSSKYKASHMKGLVWWVAHRARKAADALLDEAWSASVALFLVTFALESFNETAEDKVLQTLGFTAWNLQRAIEIFDNSGMLLEERMACEAHGRLMNFFRGYTFLASLFYEQRLMLYRVRPKMHYMWHQAQQVLTWRINPGCFDNFSEESLLGHVKGMARACHGSTVTTKLFCRYLLSLAIEVSRHEDRIAER